MNVLLIHPPDNKNTIAPGRFEPIALEVLAATIPDYETRMLDLRIEGKHALEKALKEFEPRVAGITVNNSVHVKQAYQVISMTKSICPEITLIIGGHHPTMLPSDFHLPEVDFIFLGWAEQSFPEFIHCHSKGLPVDHIPGLEILENGKLRKRKDNNWDLHTSDIPFPDRRLARKYWKRYRSDTGFPTALVNTTRGCNNRCTFCSVWRATNGHFIARSPTDVFEEIAAIPDNIHHVFFADDNTFINTKNATKLCELIKKSRIRKKYYGYCRSDTVIRHPELMQEWKNIGLNNLCVGMESINNEILEVFNKKNSISANEKAATILNDIRIPFRSYFLINPSFEMEDFKKIRNYVRKLNLQSPIFPILTPVPGSIYYDEVKDNITLGYEFFDYAHAVTPTKMAPGKFYKAWIKLFLGSYSLSRNFKCSVRRSFARLIGNKTMEKKNYHYNLICLLALKFVSIFMIAKLKKHWKQLDAGSIPMHSSS